MTIESIRSTSPEDVEVIVVDDNSTEVLVLKDPKAKIIRSNSRLGAGKSRHLAAIAAESKNLLLLDSHMRFEPGWYEEAMLQITLPENCRTLWSGVCLGLEEGRMDIKNHAGQYSGADIIFYGKSKVFEGVWCPPKDEKNYEIPCVMGASYFVTKAWFLHLRGLEHNRLWGSEEPFLSLKSWYAGGSVRLLTGVKIGHKFKSSTPYVTPVPDILYNKLRAMKVLLHPETYEELCSKMPQDANLAAAKEMLEADALEIEFEISYYKKIFIRDLSWFLSKFGFQTSF